MQRVPIASCLLSSLLFATACCGEGAHRSVASGAHIQPEAEEAAGVDLDRDGDVLHGEASYYADFFDGRKTASGDRYDPNKMTAANRTLPLGTRVRIRRVDTGASVVVTVNDRGPFGKRRRIFDLSKAAAKKLHMLERGTAQVEAVVLD
ncbi:MAG: Rare lipoprotein precursor [Myxococcaceae bacterium]|nr:Rare lipoprotein precursor [Myxococcaceae bacterium]